MRRCEAPHLSAVPRVSLSRLTQMRPKRSKTAGLPLRTALAVTAALALCAGIAATAAGLVSVYSNNLASKAQYRELSRAGGGDRNCHRSYRSKAETMRVNVRASVLCAFSPPVQGDAPRPDHDFAVDGRVLKGTPKKVRKAAYLAIQVRLGRGDSYELQVRPKSKRFKLVRNPDGAEFPVSGESRDIGGIGDRNKLRLRAEGSRITAYVNGKRLAKVNDPDADDFKGARLAFGAGSRRNAENGPVATFDRIRVRVPSP
jgi:hypothetical protein